MSEEVEIKVDGIWRPEAWTNGRYLVVRYVLNDTGQVTRKVHSDGKFSSFANIFESEDSAEAECERLNAALVADLTANLPPPGSTENKETDQ